MQQKPAQARGHDGKPAVLYMASLPLDANVLFMTVMATKMPFVGGDKNPGEPAQLLTSDS